MGQEPDVGGGQPPQHSGGAACQGAAVDTAELARGGEALLRRLANAGSANAELRRQLEVQSREIAVLEESGRVQQQLLRDFELHVQQARQGEASTAEARARSEASETERQLCAELEAARRGAQAERAELLERLRRCDRERGLREGERDEARINALAQEERLRLARKAPDCDEERLRALQMEAGLVRSRMSREVAAREAAERAAAEAWAEQQELHARLKCSTAQVLQLRRALAAASELVAFRRELHCDLQAQLREQQAEMEAKLRHERGKLRAMARLEEVLPKALLMKALD